MTRADFQALLPLLALGTTALAVMVVIAIRRDHRAAAITVFVGHALALMALPLASGAAPRSVTPLVVVDGYALFYLTVLISTGLAIAILSFGYLEHGRGQKEEYYALLVLAEFGAGTLVVAAHFAAFFLGLELLSVSLYGLISYARSSGRALEAGIKYLMLSAASSAFLLFGMAVLYFHVGAMSFGGLGLSAAAGTAPLAFLGGLALMLTTVAFKLALVPFHLWTPDVYEGAPAPVTAFIATISKLGVVAVILRLLVITDAVHEPAVELALSVVAAASMVIGNVLALRQDNIKRLLAYSSIAHFGYVLVIVVASGTLIVEATTFYLLAYVVTTLGAFAIVTVRSRDGREADRLDDYRGLWWERPWLAATFGAMLLSLAGIPLTAGFLAKFYVLAAAVETSRWWLAFVLIMNSVIGLYYYLRVIVVMLAAPSAQPTPERGVAAAPAWGGRVVLAAVGLAVLALGIYPQPVITVIRSFRLTPY